MYMVYITGERGISYSTVQFVKNQVLHAPSPSPSWMYIIYLDYLSVLIPSNGGELMGCHGLRKSVDQELPEFHHFRDLGFRPSEASQDGKVV
jgi:hypothetical protein